MVSRMLRRKLFRDVRSRKGSLAALVMIVSAGVGVFVGLLAVFRDLDSARARYYQEHRLADFSVTLKRAPDRTTDMARTVPNVREVRGRIQQSVLVDLTGRVKPIPGMALSLPLDRHSLIGGVMLKTGAWFSGDMASEVILDFQFAREHNLRPGDRVKVLLLDRQHDLLVVGTGMSPEFVYLIPPSGGLAPDPAGYAVMYLPHRFMQESCDMQGAYNQLVGLAFDNSRIALKEMLHILKERLNAFGVLDTTPVHEETSVSVLRDELYNLKVTATVFPAIFLGVAALVLNIIMGRMVAQHRNVIGTLRALGHSASTMTLHYLGHGVIVGASGGICGIAVGIWLQYAMLGMYKRFFAMPGIVPHTYPGILVTGFLIALVCAILGTARGVRQAARLEPAQAMHPPPPEKGGRVLPERIPFVWKRLSFRHKMMLRAIFRNPFRSMVSVTACAVATALIVATLCLHDSTYYMMDYHFMRISHEDLTVALRDPRGPGSVSEVAGMPTVSAAEPQLTVACEMTYGPHVKRAAVTGLSDHARLTTPLTDSGKQLVIPDAGVVLTTKLAEILDVSVGDHVRVRPLLGRREETTVPVVKVIDGFLGLSAYCHIRYLSTLVGEEWVTNAILASSFPGSWGTPLMPALKERPLVISITERTRSLEQMHKTIGEFMGGFILVTIGFSGVIAFGSVLNSALVSLSERRREVGMLRVLGYRPGQVSRIFSHESFLLNGVGVVVGLALGVALAHLITVAYNTELYRFPVVIYPSRVAITAALMTAFVTAAQLIVHRMVKALDMLDVLKVRE
ncbi:MAG: ABC transporter permease [Thermodesulfobacteriota bacterium]